jgi:hypothetical protein
MNRTEVTTSLIIETPRGPCIAGRRTTVYVILEHLHSGCVTESSSRNISYCLIRSLMRQSSISLFIVTRSKKITPTSSVVQRREGHATKHYIVSAPHTIRTYWPRSEPHVCVVILPANTNLAPYPPTTIKILLDHDIEGYAVFLQAGLRETGWDQYFTVEFCRLHDIGLSDDQSDQDIWRRVQHDRLLLITHNRNRDDENSLQATIETETRPDSLSVLTIPNIAKLTSADYRRQTVHKLAEVVLYLEHYLGVGRVYLP